MYDLDNQCDCFKWISGNDDNEIEEVGNSLLVSGNLKIDNEDEFDLCLYDFPPNIEFFKEFIHDLDITIIPVEGRLSVEKSISLIDSAGTDSDIIIVPNKIDLKHKSDIVNEINKIPNMFERNIIVCDPIPYSPLVKTRSEDSFKPLWEVPYGKNTTTCSALKNYFINLKNILEV